MAKKLSKAQVKARLKQIHKGLFVLERDRMEHTAAHTEYAISLAKLMNTSDMIARAIRKL